VWVCVLWHAGHLIVSTSFITSITYVRGHYTKRPKSSLIPRRFLDMTLNSAGLELVALPLPDAATGRPWNHSVNHLDPRPRQRDSLADAHLTKKRRYGTGRERARTVIERYLLLASDKMS
jgi:hypothetical protein